MPPNTIPPTIKEEVNQIMINNPARSTHERNFEMTIFHLFTGSNNKDLIVPLLYSLDIVSLATMIEKIMIKNKI